MKVGSASLFDFKSPVSGSPIRWLVICGALLIAAIAVGTAVAVGNFRERALVNSERELENTVLLLARHFDQQLEDFTVIQKDVIAQIKRVGINTPDDFRAQMGTSEMARSAEGQGRRTRRYCRWRQRVRFRGRTDQFVGNLADSGS